MNSVQNNVRFGIRLPFKRSQEKPPATSNSLGISASQFEFFKALKVELPESMAFKLNQLHQELTGQPLNEDLSALELDMAQIIHNLQENRKSASTSYLDVYLNVDIPSPVAGVSGFQLIIDDAEKTYSLRLSYYASSEMEAKWSRLACTQNSVPSDKIGLEH